jgi:hypothetical protein
MKPIWWLLIIAVGIVFIALGHLNWQVSKFPRFIILFLLSLWVALFFFWFFLRGKIKE